MKITPKRSKLRRPRQPMPAFVRRALTEHDLFGRYRERPPYQQNDYLWWINSAQREATKNKRLTQMLEELEGGTLYMNMKWSGPHGRSR
jgi:hypothetical protein